MKTILKIITRIAALTALSMSMVSIVDADQVRVADSTPRALAAPSNEVFWTTDSTPWGLGWSAI
jgi:hypothetical protein